MTALNTLNESMQGQCRTLIDFADEIRAFKEKVRIVVCQSGKQKVCFLSYFELVN